jgi:hypothetical protein
MEPRRNQGVTTLVTDPSSSTGSKMPLTTGAGGVPTGESMDVGNNPKLLERIASIEKAQLDEIAKVQQQMEATPLSGVDEIAQVQQQMEASSLSVETIINSLKVIVEEDFSSLRETNLVVFFTYILNKYYKVADGETDTRDLTHEDINKLFSGCWIVVKEDPDTNSGEGGAGDRAMEYSSMPPLFKYFYVLASERWPRDAPEKITIKGDDWDKSSHGLNKTYRPFPDPTGLSLKDRNVQINIHEKIGSCNQINDLLGRLSSGDTPPPVDNDGNIALVMGYQEKIEGGGDDEGDYNSPFSYTWFQTENASSEDKFEHGLNWLEYKRTGRNIGPCNTRCGQTEAQFYRSQMVYDEDTGEPRGGFIKQDGKARYTPQPFERWWVREDFPPIILVPKQNIHLHPDNIARDIIDLRSMRGEGGEGGPILAAVQPEPEVTAEPEPEPKHMFSRLMPSGLGWFGGGTKKRRRKYKKIKHKKKKTYKKRKTYKKMKHIKRKKTYKKNL